MKPLAPLYLGTRSRKQRTCTIVPRITRFTVPILWYGTSARSIGSIRSMPETSGTGRRYGQFIAFFIAHIETGKRLRDGRQFALISLNTISSGLGISKVTARAMVCRVTLNGKYAYLCEDYDPIIELVEGTVAGAKDGRWGFGYAPIMPGTGFSKGSCTGTDSLRETEPEAETPGTVSSATGMVSDAPWPASSAPGSAIPHDTIPSVLSIISTPLSSPDSAEVGYRELVKMFPFAPGDKDAEC